MTPTPVVGPSPSRRASGANAPDWPDQDDLIKAKVPAGYRPFDRDSKNWTVMTVYTRDLIAVLKRPGYPVLDCGSDHNGDRHATPTAPLRKPSVLATSTGTPPRPRRRSEQSPGRGPMRCFVPWGPVSPRPPTRPSPRVVHPEGGGTTRTRPTTQRSPRQEPRVTTISISPGATSTEACVSFHYNAALVELIKSLRQRS